MEASRGGQTKGSKMIQQAETLRVDNPNGKGKTVIVTMTDEAGNVTTQKVGGARAARAKAAIINCQTGAIALRSDVVAAAKEAARNTAGYKSGIRNSTFKFNIPACKHIMVTVNP